MEPTLHTLSALLILAALLSRARQEDWWMRMFDFPRPQLALLGLAVLAGYFFWRPVPAGALDWALRLGLAAATLFQALRILPFTPLARRQVHGASVTEQAVGGLRLMVANVYMYNRNAQGLIELVRRHRPDLLLVLEADDYWEERLRPLEAELPHTVKHPLPNTYGMLLFSRLELEHPEVRFLLDPEVPSIVTTVHRPKAPPFRFFGLHPLPPRPEKQQDSTHRDAELVLVGRQVRDLHEPVVVAGDLNDVAWSYTTTLFQRISGLLDPRRGRGMFNTFSARNPLLRYSLDHIFHSGHFRLVRMKRLPDFGSDHFPILVELAFSHEAAHAHETPEPDGSDVARSREFVDRAREES